MDLIDLIIGCIALLGLLFSCLLVHAIAQQQTEDGQNQFGDENDW